MIGVCRASSSFPARLPRFGPLVLRDGQVAPARANHYMNVYARLKPGVSLEAARADMIASATISNVY